MQPKVGFKMPMCIHSALFHGSETREPRVSDLDRIKHSDSVMMRLVCITLRHKPSSMTMCANLLLPERGVWSAACICPPPILIGTITYKVYIVGIFKAKNVIFVSLFS